MMNCNIFFFTLFLTGSVRNQERSVVSSVLRSARRRQRMKDIVDACTRKKDFESFSFGNDRSLKYSLIPEERKVSMFRIISNNRKPINTKRFEFQRECISWFLTQSTDRFPPTVLSRSISFFLSVISYFLSHFLLNSLLLHSSIVNH